MSGKRPHDDDPEMIDDEGDSMEEFAEALAVSLRPRDIDPAAHEAILARVLGEGVLGEDAGDGSVVAPEAPAQEDEARRAEILRALLEPNAKKLDQPLAAAEEKRLAALARALRLAYAPTEIDELSNERLLKPGLAIPARRTVRRYVAVTTFALVAAAAVVFGIFVKQPKPGTSAMRTTNVTMIEARSTTSLFTPEPFPKSGGTTSRMDKIESSRSSELRDNLFSSWGVQ